MIGKKTKGVISFIKAVVIGYFLLLLVLTGWPIVRNRVPNFKEIEFVSINIFRSTDRYMITPEKHPWLLRSLVISMKFLPPPLLSGVGTTKFNRLVFHLKNGTAESYNFKHWDSLYWDFNYPARRILTKIREQKIGLNEGWSKLPVPERIIFQDAKQSILVTDVSSQETILEFVKRVALKTTTIQKGGNFETEIKNKLKDGSALFCIDLFFSHPVTINTEYSYNTGKYKSLTTHEIIVMISQVKKRYRISAYFNNPNERSYFYDDIVRWNYGLDSEKDKKQLSQIINIFNNLKNKPTAEIKGFEKDQ